MKKRYLASLAEKHGVLAIVIKKGPAYKRDQFELNLLESYGYSSSISEWYIMYTERNLMNLFKLHGSLRINIDLELVWQFTKLIDKYCED